MDRQTTDNYTQALGKLRADLKLKRGYGSRLAKSLKVSRSDIYNVAWGRSTNPLILKALVNEAQNGHSSATESLDIISTYLSSAAA